MDLPALSWFLLVEPPLPGFYLVSLVDPSLVASPPPFRPPGDDALEVDATAEERDMWRAHLERGDYAAALLHCRT
jgi:hypothetical protein